MRKTFVVVLDVEEDVLVQVPAQLSKRDLLKRLQVLN